MDMIKTTYEKPKIGIAYVLKNVSRSYRITLYNMYSHCTSVYVSSSTTRLIKIFASLQSYYR